jgi:hypothetical protein
MSQQNRLKAIQRELSKLRRMNVRGRKKFFKTCSKECVNRICECVQNVLNANLPIKPSHLKKLGRHKQTLRTLVAKRTSLAKRKRILQKGGFIGTLLSALVPAFGEIVKIFMKNGKKNDSD